MLRRWMPPCPNHDLSISGEAIMSLDNQIALVTGASRGIGKAILEELGKQGADRRRHGNIASGCAVDNRESGSPWVSRVAARYWM